LEAVEIDFYQNPAEYTAEFIKQRGFDPLSTLIISPTQRFKTYLAGYLLKEYETEALIAPFITTSSQLKSMLAAVSGCQIAGKMECFTMLYEAASSIQGIEVLFGKRSKESFAFFQASAEMVLKLFDELNNEEIDLEKVVNKLEAIKTYRKFKDDVQVLKNLYNEYYSFQKSKEKFDEGFLLSGIKKEHICSFFKAYKNVLFTFPVSLTGFEKRVYSQIKEKLFIIYQDSPDYDFSKIQGFREIDPDISYFSFSSEKNQKKPSESISIKEKKILTTSAPTRMEQVMMVLSIIKKEFDSGLNPEEIAVINIDSQFSEMLYYSLLSLGYEVNFSEGLKVNKTPLYQLLNLIYRFFNSGYDSELFIELVKNEFFSEIAGRETTYAEIAWLKKEVQRNRFFRLPSLDVYLIGSEPGRKKAFKLFENVFRANTFKELYCRLEELFSHLKKKRTYEFYTVKDILFNTAIELEELSLKVKESPLEILLNILGTKRYPVKGVYTSGIQIIGILETRGISFRCIIVPSFNEGFFPKLQNDSVIFNTESRRILGLPTLFDIEDLQFYYLKRIVDSSEKCYLLHIDDKRGAIDIKSRYYYLLGETLEFYPALLLPCVLYENLLPKQFVSTGEHKSISGNYSEEMVSIEEEKINAGKIPFEKKSIPEITSTEKRLLSIQDNIVAKIFPGKTLPVMNIPQYEFSRLDLDRLKRCETMYYIARILKIEGEKLLLKEIEREIVGLIVHEILNKLYRDIDFERDFYPEKADLSSEKISQVENHEGGEKSRFLKEKLNALIEEHFRTGLFYTKEEVVLKRLLQYNLEQVIERDQERFQKGFRVCSKYIEREFQVKIGEGKKYTLRGRIDRIDRTPEGKYMIIDYKTGSIPEKADHFPEKGFAEVQLGFYGLLFKKAYYQEKIDSLCYYDLTGTNDLVTIIDNEEIDTYLVDFETYLLEYLGELNQKSELSLTENYKNCDYCSYHSICRVYEK